MARITISWKNYEGCPEATNYSRNRAYLGWFLSVACNLWVLSTVFSIFIYLGAFLKSGDWFLFLDCIKDVCVIGIFIHIAYYLFPYYTERGAYLRLFRAKGMDENGEKKMKESFSKGLKVNTINFYFTYYTFLLIAGAVIAGGYSLFRVMGNEAAVLNILVFVIALLVIMTVLIVRKKIKPLLNERFGKK